MQSVETDVINSSFMHLWHTCERTIDENYKLSHSLQRPCAKFKIQYLPCTNEHTCTCGSYRITLMKGTPTHPQTKKFHINPCYARSDQSIYLRVTIIYRYIFLRFLLKTHFACTNICDVYTDMAKWSSISIHNPYHSFYTHWANPQKYQMLVPEENSHLKISMYW